MNLLLQQDTRGTCWKQKQLIYCRRVPTKCFNSELQTTVQYFLVFVLFIGVNFIGEFLMEIRKYFSVKLMHSGYKFIIFY